MAFALANNEFLSTLTNLCLQVMTFNNLQFKAPFDVHRREFTKWGDKIACVNAWIKDGANYSKTATPFSANEPDVTELTITTVLKKVYSLQLAEPILQGAFEDENSLADFIQTLVSQLETKSEIDIYEQIVKDFATDKLLAANGGNITETAAKKQISVDFSTKDKIQESFAKILETANKMKLPNNNYGNIYDTTAHKAKLTCAQNTRIILYLTPEANAKFNVFVHASLFNNDKMKVSDVIDEIKVVDINTISNSAVTGTTCGILLTEDAYRYSTRIKEMRNNPNGAAMSQNYWYHVWTNMGFTGAGQSCIIQLPAA